MTAETVLVIDAEVLVRHEIAEYLRGCGYRVIEASDTDEAMTVIEHSGLVLDVVLCDAQAVGTVNAFALVREVRERAPDLEVVLAGNVEKAAKAAGTLCDEGPHLARPYDPVLVLDRIRRRLAARDRARDEG
ncbi:MAG: response regulator [Paracoccaceae bacterium]